MRLLLLTFLGLGGVFEDPKLENIYEDLVIICGDVRSLKL